MTNGQNEAMEAKFNTICQEAKDALASAEKSDVLARYKVGQIVLKVMDEAEYGEKGVERMEGVLGLDAKTLYRYAKVADVWKEADFAALAERKNKKGLPLSWSHYEVLALEVDGRSRKKVVERALKEGLSVRALRTECKASAGEASPKAGSAPVSALSVLEGCLETAQKTARRWVEEDLRDVKSSLPSLADSDLKELRDMRRRVDEFAETLDEISSELDRILNEVKPAVRQEAVVEVGVGVG